MFWSGATLCADFDSYPRQAIYLSCPSGRPNVDEAVPYSMASYRDGDSFETRG
jgi:hypothetical protein